MVVVPTFCHLIRSPFFGRAVENVSRQIAQLVGLFVSRKALDLHVPLAHGLGFDALVHISAYPKGD